MNKVLLIIPALNEEENIGSVIDSIRERKNELDIIIINDGSTDKTEAVVKSKDVDIISLPFNLCYGGALQTGFKYAVSNGYEKIIQFDADGQHDPNDIGRIMECLDKDDADMIIGSRFNGTDGYDPGVMKRICISFLRLFISALTDKKISDPTSGLKGLRSSIFSYYASSDHYSIDYPDADILIQGLRKGYTFKEIPIKIRNRIHGQSMHSGLKPVYYFIKFILNTVVIMLRGQY